jgi:hypothetical protein
LGRGSSEREIDERWRAKIEAAMAAVGAWGREREVPGRCRARRRAVLGYLLAREGGISAVVEHAELVLAC